MARPRTSPLETANSSRPRAIAVLWVLGALLFSSCSGDVEARMREVRALQDVGQFSASIGELREILTVDPDLPEANFRLGLALVQTGEPTRAAWPLQKASESSEYEITAGVLLASTYFQTKNYDEAIRAASRVLDSDPERPAAMRIRANANLSARHLEEALEDTTSLANLYPDDYGVRALHGTVLADLGRFEEAQAEHDLLKKMGEESDDPAFRNRACLAPATFAAEVLGDSDKARALYEDCAARRPTDPVVINHMMGFFDGIGEPERATELIRTAVETAPESLPLRHSLAMRLRNTGDSEGAEQVLLDAATSFGSAGAYSLLSSFYRTENRPEDALAAIDKVVELSGGGSDAIRFTQADILIDLEQFDRAESVADEIEQPTYAQLIRGRILLMQGDPKGALETFERGILAWPNNSGARFLAGIAARDLGDLDRAISELREAVRANNAETNAAIELSRIYYQRGDYQQAITFANTALRGPKGLDEEEAYVIAARASTAQHNDEQALRTIALLNARGHPALATREHAIFERTRSGPRAALVVIEASGLDLTDPKNEMVLRQSAESLTLLERSEQAVAEIDVALARTPDSAALHELRGIVLLRANQLDEARLAFEKAASLDDGAARPLAGLASIDAIQGDSSRAIEQFDRAYLLDPTGGGEYAYSAAQLVLASNDTAGAEARLRDIVRRNPNIIGARNDLAWILSEKGQDLDLALELAEDAYRRNPSPKVLDTLGWVYFKRGEITQAVDLLEMSAAQQPDSASVLYRLGAALTASGDENRAREMLQRALVTENFPEVDDARRVLAQLERR